MTPCSSDELHALQFEGIPQGLSLFILCHALLAMRLTELDPLPFASELDDINDLNRMTLR